MVAALFILVMVAVAAPYVIIEHPSTNQAPHAPSPLLIATIVAEVFVMIGYLIAMICVTVKRLHDRDKSGWWFIVFAVLPTILNIIGDPKTDPGLNPPVALLVVVTGLVLSIWGFVEIGCLRGTAGSNEYGPDPLEPYSSNPAKLKDQVSL